MGQLVQKNSNLPNKIIKNNNKETHIGMRYFLRQHKFKKVVNQRANYG